MGSSKRGGSENVRVVTGHRNTLHQRLYHALNLGTRVYDEKEKKWECPDIEIQRHVLRSMAAFLDCFSQDTSNNPLLKDSVADIVRALVSILRCKSQTVLSVAANVVVKLVSVVPNSVLQLYALDVVEPLSSLLSFNQPEVSLSCAVALNMFLLSVKEMKERQLWKILEETKAVTHIVGSIRNFSSATMPVEYFRDTVSLLSTILTRWPLSRYHVWNDAILMKVLRNSVLKPDMSVRVAALKLYSAVALCGHGAENLLKDGTAMLEMMINCMNTSSPQHARIEGFRLAQRLGTGKQGCLKMISMCSESLVKAITCGMSGWTLSSGKVSVDQMRLLVEACRLALITRWEGEHHILFWKHGIVEVLLNLLLEKFQCQPLEAFSSLEEQIAIAESGLNANLFPKLKPYIWDIVGFLVIHCEERFDTRMLKNKIHLDILVTCACLAFLESIQKGRQICQNDISRTSGAESASRAVLMMLNSPCKYFASKVRHTFLELLKSCGEQNVKSLLQFLDYTSSDKSSGLPNTLQTALCLMGLMCYSGLPQYWKLVIENKGIETLLSFSSWYLRNHARIDRSSFAPHLLDVAQKRTCCWASTEDWDAKDTLLFYALWSLTELVLHSSSERNYQESYFGMTKHVKDQFFRTLQEIRDCIYAPGPRWYAAHILSYFGHYGFQSKLGKRLMRALRVEECRDMQLILADGNNLSVHRFILAVRCPSLLPPEELPPEEEPSDHSILKGEKPPGKLQEVRLSAHVDHRVLAKLLEFIYSGHVEVERELVKKLKTLARHCNLQTLLQMLCRNRPKWGLSFPSVDLSHAFSPGLHHFSDIIVEAKETDLTGWTCCSCLSTVPHVHAHRVVLSSSCEYLRALFQSGMQESHSHSLKVPISWVAVTKLLNWFYTDELPNPPSGCIWSNMNTKAKLYELQPYVEIYWLAEFWILEDLQDVSGGVIESCLESSRELSVKIIQLAADLSLWKLAEVVAVYTGPIYHKLRDSGDLEALDEVLVDLIRAASVRFSQETNADSR